jgi:hypothetical protein
MKPVPEAVATPGDHRSRSPGFGLFLAALAGMILALTAVAGARPSVLHLATIIDHEHDMPRVANNGAPRCPSYCSPRDSSLSISAAITLQPPPEPVALPGGDAPRHGFASSDAVLAGRLVTPPDPPPIS